jgi:hypothetical protein
MDLLALASWPPLEPNGHIAQFFAYVYALE